MDDKTMKIHFLPHNYFRRIPLSTPTPTMTLLDFNTLMLKYLSLHEKEISGIPPTIADIDVQYRDDEGDWISINTDDEWSEALTIQEHQLLLRFKVIDKRFPESNTSRNKKRKLRSHAQSRSAVDQRHAYDCDDENGSEDEDDDNESADDGTGLKSTAYQRDDLRGASSNGAMASQQSDPFSHVVHHNITCDLCDMQPIRGVRYKCNECANFDLCSSCFRGATELHPSHTFTSISTPHKRMMVLPESLTLTDVLQIIKDLMKNTSSDSFRKVVESGKLDSMLKQLWQDDDSRNEIENLTELFDKSCFIKERMQTVPLNEPTTSTSPSSTLSTAAAPTSILETKPS